MALYDNKHWLLSHIRNSFISTDDTGMCELVMVGEDLSKQLCEKIDVFPVFEDSEDDDDELLPESYDIEFDLDIGVRPRTNTGLRIEKHEQAKKKAAKIKNLKWEDGNIPITDEFLDEMFSKKKLKPKDIQPSKSLLSVQLEKYVKLPKNPYMEYAKFDGNAQVGIPVRKYRIFLTMLPEDQRNYPMTISCIAIAKILDLIGLICLKSSTIHGDYISQPVQNYGLYIAEDDGEVDWDFPCLDAKETVAKFGFTCLALVEHKNVKNVSFDTEHVILPKNEEDETKIDSASEIKQITSDMQLMKIHQKTMEAPLYQSYRVYIISKVRTKTEIHLGISGEKLEIDPIQQKSSKFMLGRQKAVSYPMDSVACCEITDTKGNQCTFRIMYSLSFSQDMHKGAYSSSPLQSSASFKHYDFESDDAVAKEIVQKINLILELRSSTSRKEYLAAKERKQYRRKSYTSK